MHHSSLMKLTDAALYLHTLRHLRPGQILWRLYYKFRKPRQRRVLEATKRAIAGAWKAPVVTERSWLGGSRFRFLNTESSIETPLDWNSTALPKLWLYNLHYFDWLRSADGAEARDDQLSLMRRWVSENEYGHGNGWEPYPISLRVVNWIKFALSTGGLPEDLTDSLSTQADYLSQRVEYDILGNHLIANAKALVFSGWFFEGADADRWAHLGLEILRREIDEQILPDGGHFERSAMYHSIILEDLLDLINMAGAAGEPIPTQWIDAAGRMRRWLQAMTHPDGGIALFNDAAFDIAPSPAELEAYASRLNLDRPAPHERGLLHLSDSGYFRWRAPPLLLIGDIGPVGPDYQPGHAHADTLSFELSLDGDRLVVDSGTSTYATGEQRSFERSTAAHNAIMVDGQNSSEVWAGFRVARRADICEVDVASDGSYVCAAHDGFRRLPGRPIHRRRWRLTPDALEIIDEIDGANRHLVVMAFHFHPDVEIKLKESGLTGALGRSTFRASLPRELSWRVEPNEWRPRFGERMPNLKLIGEVTLDLPCRLATHFSFGLAA
jgi:uncharacterized heparinase superfamily protein